MPRYDVDDDDSDGWSGDNWDQGPDDSADDFDDDVRDADPDDEPTIPCPHCGEEVHEDSPRCPHCENYISREDSAAARKPVWIIAGVLLCLLAVYLWNQWINFFL